VRRASIFQLVLIGVIAGAIATAVAIFIPWMPTPASRQAGRIDFVYWFATVISLFVFAVVAAILVYAVINFRAKPGDWSDGPPIHGNTTIEIIWTVIPTVLVTAISIVSAVVLSENGHAGRNPLVVKVYGQQFAWTFTYPNGVTTTSLRLPVNRAVKLRITSKDMIHSFWVAEFSQKQDAVPGQWNDLVITPDRTGTYAVICTELCGLGHALMRSEAIVQTQPAFDAWYRSLGGHAAAGGSHAPTCANSVAVQAFTANGCAACHTLQSIPGANGKVGPPLDKLKEAAAQAGKSLDDYIEQSIKDPNGYITPGYQPGVMPGTFGTTLTKDQLDALVQYLAAHTN
jgi:cytochrome c oxidase subunit II